MEVVRLRQTRVGWVGKGFLGYCNGTDKGVGADKLGALQEPLPVSVAVKTSVRVGMVGTELKQEGGARSWSESYEECRTLSC